MNPLARSQEEYRHVFERISELALELLAELNDRSTFPNISGEESRNRFAGPLPEQGMGAAALDDLQAVIDASRCPIRASSATFSVPESQLPPPPTCLASVLESECHGVALRSCGRDPSSTLWLVGSAEAIGCAGFVGSLTGGGSSANLMALAMAREARMPANDTGIRQSRNRLRLRAGPYVDSQGGRAAGTRTGSACDRFRAMSEFRIRVDLLRQEIDEGRAGREDSDRNCRICRYGHDGKHRSAC